MNAPQFTQDNFREYAIDYLDELLSAPEHDAFEQALVRNPDWSSYVDGLRITWRRARRALQENQEKAPAHIRAHVLVEAAKRAAVMRQERVDVAILPAATLWSTIKTKLLARPWFTPALVATAAVGVYVLSQQSWKSHRPSAGSSSPLQQEVDLIQGKTDEMATQPAEKPQAELERQRHDDGPDKLEPPATKAKAVQRSAMKRRSGVGAADQAQPALNVERFAEEPPADDRQNRGWQAKLQSDERGTLGSLSSAPVGAGAEGARKDSPPKGFATPPAGWSAPVVNQGGVRSAQKEEASAEPQPPPSDREAAAPAPAANAPARAARQAAAVRLAPAAAESSEANGTADDAAPSRSDLLIKAVNAERDERWAEAVAAYRELLRRFEKDKDVAKWKQRLSAASARLR